jgi:hypothetical protein
MGGFQAMAAIFAAAITAGGVVLAAVVAAVSGFLGARHGARAGLESGRVERMWENRVSVYQELAAWVRARREVNDDRFPACLREETVQLEQEVTEQAFPKTGQLQIWASVEIRKLHYEFEWWNDWVYFNIAALQDPEGKGRYIAPNPEGLRWAYEKASKVGDQLIERVRAELSGHVR